MPTPTDEEAKLAIERIRVRGEMRSAHEEEDTGVIEVRARERTQAPPNSSTPAPAKGLVAVLNTLPPWSRPVVVLALIGAVAFGAGSKLAGWW